MSDDDPDDALAAPRPAAAPARRLVERFAVGDDVDVLLRHPSGEAWLPGRVAAHAHPGVWVAAADGARWFVTNGGRIRPATVFKVAPAASWEEAERTGVLPDSADDRRDGFVHLSASSQVRATLAKHFAGRGDLVLLDVSVGVLARARPGALRWERSRGGALFPHLHATLPREAVLRARPLLVGPDAAHVLPVDVER